jgi:hypothetical protein
MRAELHIVNGKEVVSKLMDQLEAEVPRLLHYWRLI